ncbi:MAG: hypothetical protein ACOZAM_22375 [Pseudomonadota bacterium]
MKTLRPSHFAIPGERILFFDAVFGLATASGAIDDNADPNDQIWRTYRQGKVHRIRKLVIDKRRYRLTSKVHRAEDALSRVKTKAIFEAARKVIGLVMQGAIEGRIDLHDQPALVLDRSYAHLLYSQLYTVLGTGYLRLVRDGHPNYGLVSFDKGAIAKLLESERKSSQSSALSQADKKLLIELAANMKEYAKKEYPEIYDRLSFSIQIWQSYKRKVEQWMDKRRNSPRTIIDARYRSYVAEAMVAAELRSKSGNKSADIKEAVRKVFEHFLGKADPEDRTEDSVIENQ